MRLDTPCPRRTTPSSPASPWLAGLAAVLALATLLSGAPSTAEELRTPTTQGIRYDAPDTHRSLAPHVGTPKTLEGLARQLKGDTPANTLRGLWRWVERNLKLRSSTEQGWRSVDAMIASGRRRGPGEYVVALGALARAAGIPTVWVKGATLDSIREAVNAGGDPARLELRLLLELHFDGRWHLLDPRSMTLWSSYDPTRVRLPGGALAFDKASDPKDLVLPNQPAAFATQTRAWLRRLDVRTLPWGDGVDLLLDRRVVVAGTTKLARYVRSTSESLGFKLQSTLRPSEIEAGWRTRIGGRVLVVTCPKGQPALPGPLQDRILPPGWRELLSARATRANDALQHTLSDGTRVIFVVAERFEAMEIALATALVE